MFKNKEGKVRSGWKITAVFAAFLGISLIIGTIVGSIASIILLSQGKLDPTTMEFTAEGMKDMDQVNFILMLFQEIVLMLTPIIAWKKVMKRPLSNMGLTPFKKHWKEFIAGLLFGIVSITLVFLALILTGNAIVESWSPTFSINLLTYLVLFIFVGLAEEIFGRGYIMATLRQTRKLPVVIIVSSIIFALLHGANPGIGPLPLINLTIFGIMLAYIYIKSGNIWMCIGFHISWNYFQGNIFGFKVSGTNPRGLLTTYYESNNLLNGGDFGPEGGLFVTVILILGFAFIRYYYRNSTFDFMASEPENSTLDFIASEAEAKEE
jgi:membrane protease YdiL (CAAX protease family)